MVSRYWFEALAGVPCDVEIASEFRYRKSAVRRNSLMITLSQSGETADTLAALRLSKELGYLGSLAICNVPGSSLVRESDLALMTKAGTEISVASTKAFTTQLTVLLMLVAKLARLKVRMRLSSMISCTAFRPCRTVSSRCSPRTSVLSSWRSVSLISTMRCSLAAAISNRSPWKGR